MTSSRAALRDVVGRARRTNPRTARRSATPAWGARSSTSGLTVSAWNSHPRCAATASRVPTLRRTPRRRIRRDGDRRRAARLLHVGDDRRRVDAAGQERAERNVADLAASATDFAQQAVELARGIHPHAAASPSPVNSQVPVARTCGSARFRRRGHARAAACARRGRSCPAPGM